MAKSEIGANAVDELLSNFGDYLHTAFTNHL